MRYCTRCLQPDSRPGIFFDENGVCGACLWQEEIKEINWDSRIEELRNIAENAKLKAKGAYDCVIGVSGGKDSTFQAFYARDFLNLRVLLVNCEPIEITPIGRENIENLKNHGFDIISIAPNRHIMKKLMRRDFFKYLNPVKCTEYPLYASAYIVADRFNIPLIIQGENAALTLGVSMLQDVSGSCLNVTQANTLKESPFGEYIEDGVISGKDLYLYNIPLERICEKEITGVWLNYYAKEWSQPGNAQFSLGKGLSIFPESVNPYEIGTYRRYSQLDSYLAPPNQVFKYIKFGFGQTTDHVCYDIREGLISRDEGLYLVHELDGRCGRFYFEKLAACLEMDVDDMMAYAEKFRGPMFAEDGTLPLPLPEGKYNLQDIMRRLRI